MNHCRILLIVLWMMVSEMTAAGNYADITVAADGSGNCKTLTEAMRTLPMYNYQRYVIYVKNGVYHEKILIDRDNITIRGENKDSTIIEFEQLRSDWQANPDYIGPAVINISADDIVLENLTVRNTQPQVGPHAFAIYGTGTRTIIYNCRVLSKGGDTVSLWNYKDGMYYHAGCYFEGGVDFVCPRGWCYIRDSKFYENSKTAAVWHAAVTDKNQKMVMVNCSFDGVQDFYLARHHYEAQFYFLNCGFSATMADKSIEHVYNLSEPEKNRPYFFGDRYYFFNCHRRGGNYAWFANNFQTQPEGIEPEDITAKWTFDNKWDPESTIAPVVTGYRIEERKLLLFLSEPVGVRGRLTLATTEGKAFRYLEGSGRDILAFISEDNITEKDIISLKITEGSVIANAAGIEERPLMSVHLHQ